MQELWEETEHFCVIPRSFQRYHVEVSLVRYPCSQHRRWWKANPCPKPHYEAVVTRGGVRRLDGGWKLSGDQCCGPGWHDVFGRTPAEAVSKARKLAREWVRWQLSLLGRQS
jgi:hypothetical protein